MKNKIFEHLTLKSYVKKKLTRFHFLAVFTQITKFFIEAGKYKPEKKEDEKEDCGCDKADRKHLKKDSEDPAYKYSESAQGKRL